MQNYKIIYGDSEFEASEYQNKIFDTIEHGIGNLIINASAGSSKTTTIVNAIRYIPENKKVLFVAFNKDIVKKIDQNITHPNTLVSTFHALGYAILRENKIVDQNFAYNINPEVLEYNNTSIDIYKYEKEIKKLNNTDKRYITNLKKLINYARYYNAMTVKEIENVSKIYSIVPISDEFKVCRELLIWGKEHLETIDFTDMLWLPVVLNLTTRKYRFDWIFIDEAQDTSIIEQQLIEKSFKRGTRFVATGDNNQQINVWCGSSRQAIDNLRSKPHTSDFLLPISYRCPKKIVNLAQKYSNNIIAAPNAIEGDIRYDVNINEPKNGDMVLCRNTAPLISLYTKYLERNKKCFIRGYESIQENYLSLINSFNCEFKNELVSQLYTKLFELIDNVQDKYNLTEDEALQHQSVLIFYDTILGIVSLGSGMVTVQELIDKINTIFDESSEDGVQLSTVHKAKGLEADNVYILCPSLMPSPLAKKEWEVITEDNLIYVAVTRAKKTLNYIKEDFFSIYAEAFTSFKKLKQELMEVKTKLNLNNFIQNSPKNKIGKSMGNYSIKIIDFNADDEIMVISNETDKKDINEISGDIVTPKKKSINRMRNLLNE